MPLLVRTWEPTDAAATLEVFRRSVHVTAAADCSAAQRAAWAPDDLEVQEWGRRRAAAGTRVAVHDGSVAGFTDLSARGHIGMFYVHPEHGGRGVGAALLSVLLREAAARGVQQLTVDASLTARGFFERAGFTTVREQRVQRGGQEFTNVAMRLVLPGPGDRRGRHGGGEGSAGGGEADRAVLHRAAARRRAGWALLHRRPDYPGGWAVCRAVLEGNARSRQQAERWLAAHA